MRKVAIAVVVFGATFALAAPELGRADGALTIDQNRIALGYAYAIGHQHNDITMRNDEVKVVLTEKPLAEDTTFNDIETTLPDGIFAVAFNVASNGKVTHIFVLHPKGSYDAGFLEELPDVRFKHANGSRGTVAGHVTSGRVHTNTMTFSLDADFNALVK